MPDAPPFAIHVLSRDDVSMMNGLLDLFSDAFGDPESYASARPTPAYLGRLLGSDSFIAVAATQRGEVIGGLAAYVLPKFEQERSEIYIYDLAVAAGHRRKGVATALIRQLQRVAAGRRAHVVFVQADPEDAPAIALYTGLGRREDVLHFDIEVPR